MKLTKNLSLLLIAAIASFGALAEIRCWNNHDVGCPEDYAYYVDDFEGTNWLVTCRQDATQGHPITYPEAIDVTGMGGKGYCDDALVTGHVICDYKCTWQSDGPEFKTFTTYTYKIIQDVTKVKPFASQCRACRAPR